VESNELSEQLNQLGQLVVAVLKSPKYRNVCEDLIRSIGMQELSKRRNLKTAIKFTKNRLHQIGGSYFLAKPNYGLWLERLRGAKRSGDKDLFRKICAEIMSHHYSTRERLSILDEFYTRIFSLLPRIRSVMDVGCGLNPLSIPWMPLSSETKYYAYDIYKDMTSFLNDFMIIANIQGFAETRDVIQSPPHESTDLALILDTLPCLEQIDRSAGLKVLETINANFLVVSYPLQTLGGREKGMREHYEARFNRLTGKKDWLIQRLEFRNELVFLITKET